MKKIFLLLFLLPLAVFSQQMLPVTASAAKVDYSEYFENAYQQFPDIPRGVLEAVAYGNTHIFHLTHAPGQEESCMGLPLAYGVMGLVLDGKGYFSNNLVDVSNLSGISTDDIITNPEQNILAYAGAFNSVMTTLKNQAGEETKPDDIIFNTFMGLSELPQEDEGQLFAVYSQLYSYFWFMAQPDFQANYRFPNHNVDLHTLFGEENYRVLSSEHLLISEDGGVSDTYGNVFKSTGGNSAPTVQSVDYAPAIWNQAATCNFSSRSQAVTAVTIHDVEGSYASCISWFQNCNAGVSAHYVVRSSDGQVTQMVLESKKAWHVGTENGYTVGIEHEGYASQTGWYTNAMVQSSANLVKDICLSQNINPAAAYNGPSCNCHSTQPASVKIKGHQHNPNTGKVDPGINWPWGTFYSLINNTSTTCGIPSGLSATSVATNSAALGWAAVSGALSYNIQYKPSSSSTWLTVTSTTNSVTINGLTAATSYDFKVQAVCSSAGSYSSVTSFTTTAALTNDNCANAEEIYPNSTCIQTAGNVAGSTVSGLPKASCDGFGGTPKLLDVWYKFQATSATHIIKVSPSVSFDAVVALHTSCSGGQIGCADNGGGSGAAETITANGLTIGTTYYLRVYAYGSSIPATTTFNICITGASTPCGVPSGLAVSSVSLSTANLNWASVSGAVSYNVQYKPVSSSTWTTVSTSTNSVVLSGLNVSTAYEYKVQAVCSSAGSYSAVANFTTSSGSSSSTTITVGTATTPYSAHPFGTVYMDERVQYIYKKPELTAAGWTSAEPYLKSISFYVSSVSPQAMNTFKITMAHTSGNSFTNTSFVTGTNTTTVFTGTVSLVQGWNTLTFSTPFSYNGSSNVLMNICWNNNSFTHNSAVHANSYPGYQALYYRADLSNSGPCAKTTGTRSYYRPNTKFEFSSTLTISSSSSFTTQQEQEHRNGNLISESEADLEIFPNPMSGDVMNGKLTNTVYETMMVKMYDVLGRELLSKEVTLEEGAFAIPLDAGQLKTGTYMIVGIAGTERFIKKLMVK